MSVKRFFYLFVFFTFSTVSLLSEFNYIVDPYLLYQSKRVPGFNDKKPAAANRSVLYKPYNVVSIRPQTIVAGNSRPEMGIDPNSPSWPEEYGIVYNLTFPGQSTYNQVRALFHGVATGQVEHVLLGIDFNDFLHKRRNVKEVVLPKHNSDFFKRLLINEEFEENNGYWMSKIKDFSKALFSLDTLSDSIYTILSQTPNSTDRSTLGFNMARDYYEIVRYEGAWVLFEQKLTELEVSYFQPGLSLYDSGQWSVELEAIKRVVQMAIDKNIRLILFINPYHYTYLETIHNAGYWAEFEEFKRGLTNAVNQYGKKQVALWDFALYSSYTVSPVPKKGDGNPILNWFWEPAHYKAELGDLMLADMFGLSSVKYSKGPVGVKLNDVNIESHLRQQRERRSIMLLLLSNTALSLQWRELICE